MAMISSFWLKCVGKGAADVLAQRDRIIDRGRSRIQLPVADLNRGIDHELARSATLHELIEQAFECGVARKQLREHHRVLHRHGRALGMMRRGDVDRIADQQDASPACGIDQAQTSPCYGVPRQWSDLFGRFPNCPKRFKFEAF